MNTKRGKGRPKGDGIKDGALLAVIADAVLADPRVKVATLVRRVIATSPKGYVEGASMEATVRRIQSKWAARRLLLLIQARTRRDEARAMSMSPPAPASRGGTRRYNAVDEAMASLGMAGPFGARRRPETTLERAAREIQASVDLLLHGPGHSIARAIQAARNGGALASARALANAPAFQAARTLASDPTLLAFRTLTDTPAHRALRELVHSPGHRAIRELHEGATMRAIRALHGRP